MDIFENICRTCGNDCLDAINVFEDSVTVLEKRLPIIQILKECMPDSLSLPAVSKDDNYPKQICRVCIKKLTMIYEFHRKWQTASSEFNVALRFEQRRNRARNYQLQAAADELMANTNGNEQFIEEGIVLKHEPSEDNELDTLIYETQLEPELDAKTRTLGDQLSNKNYQCTLCEERFHTFPGYQKHHKVSHRNCQFVCNTPGPAGQYH